MEIFNRGGSKEIYKLQLACGEIITTIPLNEDEITEMNQLEEKRNDLELQGKILFIQQTRRLAGLKYRYHNFNDIDE